MEITVTTKNTNQAELDAAIEATKTLNPIITSFLARHAYRVSIPRSLCKTVQLTIEEAQIILRYNAAQDAMKTC